MMAQMKYEQENDGLTGIPSFPKIQTSGLNRKSNVVVNTPMTKGFSLKTPMNTSSRKAFGNVSNVLSSNQTINSKVKPKNESVVKDLHKSAEESKIDLNPNEIKLIETEAETACNANSKFMDQIESMFPNEEELMSEVNDSITAHMFAVDEQTLFGMKFDSEMSEYLVPPKNANFNIDDLF